MENFEKKEQLNQLFDLYQNLLTDKQKAYFKYSFYDDYSLQEIADIFNVSRNAVYDQLKKVEKHLLDYEEKLELLDKRIKRRKIILKIKQTKQIELLDEIGKLDE
jgi:predicted DNA-binding protein YlxM (UPF0122 family)